MGLLQCCPSGSVPCLAPHPGLALSAHTAPLLALLHTGLHPIVSVEWQGSAWLSPHIPLTVGAQAGRALASAKPQAGRVTQRDSRDRASPPPLQPPGTRRTQEKDTTKAKAAALQPTPAHSCLGLRERTRGSEMPTFPDRGAPAAAKGSSLFSPVGVTALRYVCSFEIRQKILSRATPRTQIILSDSSWRGAFSYRIFCMEA